MCRTFVSVNPLAGGGGTLPNIAGVYTTPTCCSGGKRGGFPPPTPPTIINGVGARVRPLPPKLEGRLIECCRAEGAAAGAPTAATAAAAPVALRVRFGGGEGVSLSSRRSGERAGSRSSSPRGALLGRRRVVAGVRRDRGGVGCRAVVAEVVRRGGVVASSGMASILGDGWWWR